MADIKPFAALRPAADQACAASALPYDVYSVEESRRLVGENPLSFLRIDEPAVNFPEGTDADDPAIFTKAGELFNQAREEGLYVPDDQPCYYLYELTMNGRTQTGLVNCASIDDYLNGAIKKHENTRAGKENGRVAHVRACSAHTGPIYLAHPPHSELARIYEGVKKTEPIFDFEVDGVTHRGFTIDDPETIERITQLFSLFENMYIADGHHRAAAAVHIAQEERASHPDYDGSEEFNWFLNVCFPANELHIFDYNRVVKGLNGLTPQELVESLSERMEVDPLHASLLLAAEAGAPERDLETLRREIRPMQKGDFSMFLNGIWYLCSIDPTDRSYDPVGGLDVSLLQNLVLEPLLGISDPRTDARIDFVGGIRGLDGLERRCREDCDVAFALFPTSIQELFTVADAGMLMPPKSTWFEPKLRSGLFIHLL